MMPSRRASTKENVADADRSLDLSLSLSVSQAFQTQKVVEQEARSLQAQAAKFSKQTQQWMGCIGAFDQALKELGDFENYVRTLEWEIQTVSDALERAATAGPPEGENQ